MTLAGNESWPHTTCGWEEFLGKAIMATKIKDGFSNRLTVLLVNSCNLAPVTIENLSALAKRLNTVRGKMPAKGGEVYESQNVKQGFEALRFDWPKCVGSKSVLSLSEQAIARVFQTWGPAVEAGFTKVIWHEERLETNGESKLLPCQEVIKNLWRLATEDAEKEAKAKAEAEAKAKSEKEAKAKAEAEAKTKPA